MKTGPERDMSGFAYDCFAINIERSTPNSPAFQFRSTHSGFHALDDQISFEFRNGSDDDNDFDYLVAKDRLKQAREAEILVALNAQAAQAEGCFTCHSLHGRGGQVGPDLGLERSRNRSDAWLINHFKDPPAYSPKSVMPSFAGLTSAQLQTLAGFLQCQR